MGRPHRRQPGIDLDPYQSDAYQHDRLANNLHDDSYPSRGRSPGPHRRNRSEPAATVDASYDDKGHEPKEPRESRKHRRDRKDKVHGNHQGIASDDHAAQVDSRQDRKQHKARYYDDDGAYPRRARNHGRSAVGPHRSVNNYEDFDAYAPASHRGRERQHAYHPPRTSETRRSKHPDYDPESRLDDKLRSRYADYDPDPPRVRYPDDDADPRASRRRRSRHADYGGDVPRGGSEWQSPRYPDYEPEPRSRTRDHASRARGRHRTGSPGRYPQAARQSTTRGRSMPRNPATGAAGGGRPRAKSAVGYAALGEAAQTAFRVGSQAAYQMRNEPGPWIGEKGTRVATAALGAALVDTFVGHKASNMKGGMRHQALRQACEMGIRNFVMQPAVNSVNHRSGSGGGGGGASGGRRRR